MNASSPSSPGANESTPLCFSINSPPFPQRNTTATLSAVFSSLGLTSNLIALVVLVNAYKRTHSRSRSFFLIFLGGLVTTDFMGLLVTGTIVLSFYATQFNWRELDPHCHFCNFMGMSMVFYGLCPLLLGAAMAVERFVGINRPFARSSSMPRSRAVVMVLMVWTFAGCMALLPLARVGSYHIQRPGSWCFLNISSQGSDMLFSMLFSGVGLASIGISFVLNTVSVATLIRVCCGQDKAQRRRDYEVEMMVQLLLIMVIGSLCWCPLLVSGVAFSLTYILRSVVTESNVDQERVLFFLRMATCNQILDPWIYIMCQESRMSWREEFIFSKGKLLFFQCHEEVFIAQTVLLGRPLQVHRLLLWLRFASCNQILDPWVYILFRRAVLRRFYPSLRMSRDSIMNLYPSLRRMTRTYSLGGGGSLKQDEPVLEPVTPTTPIQA